MTKNESAGAAIAGQTDEWYDEFANDVQRGLSADCKHLPCKYLYNEEGSRLFKEIMELEEYYPTRCEMEIIDRYKADMAELIGPEDFNLVELGAGDGLKTKILLGHFLERNMQFRYVPIDISRSAIQELTEELEGSFRDLHVQGLTSEYFTGLKWLSHRNHRRNVLLFLGSNIGNFHPHEAGIFLSHLQDSLNDGDFVLIGFDLKKDTETLRRAYNDSQGVTARFNKNLLRRINDELGGNFSLQQFTYYSTYNPLSGAVESFLISRKKQRVYIEACRQSFVFAAWEPIHTESSYKFRENDMSCLAREKGLELLATFSDKRRFFADSLWRVRKVTSHKKEEKP